MIIRIKVNDTDSDMLEITTINKTSGKEFLWAVVQSDMIEDADFWEQFKEQDKDMKIMLCPV